MSIKLILLKSGEDIITDISEMYIGDEDKRVVGYYLNRPCIVKMITQEEDDNSGFEVSLFPWMPLSSDEVIPIAVDWLITMVEPVDKLKEMYVEDVLNGQDGKDDSSDNEGDTDISD